MKRYTVDGLPATRGEVMSRKASLTYVGWVKAGNTVTIQYRTK